MIVFRHTDPRFPFLWESADQPSARWHSLGEGPVHYLAETSDGAWAEFLRHEEIVDPADLAGVARSLWSIDLPRPPRSTPRLETATLMGGISTYGDCQRTARRMRSIGARGLVAPSAALAPASPSGFRTEDGLQAGPERAERVFVLFGPRPDLVGWAACHEGRPRADLLPRVRALQ
jgi:RES domain